MRTVYSYIQPFSCKNYFSRKPRVAPYTLSAGCAESYTECDAADGVGQDLQVFLFSTDSEDHMGCVGDGGGGVQRFTKPALGSTLIHLHCDLQANREGPLPQDTSARRLVNIFIFSMKGHLKLKSNSLDFPGHWI